MVIYRFHSWNVFPQPIYLCRCFYCTFRHSFTTEMFKFYEVPATFVVPPNQSLNGNQSHYNIIRQEDFLSYLERNEMS